MMNYDNFIEMQKKFERASRIQIEEFSQDKRKLEQHIISLILSTHNHANHCDNYLYDSDISNSPAGRRYMADARFQTAIKQSVATIMNLIDKVK